MCWETNCPNMSCNSWCVENHASLLGVFDFWPGWCGRPTPAWRRRTSDSASWEATCTARWTTAASSWWPRSSGRLQHTNHKTHVKPTSTHEFYWAVHLSHWAWRTNRNSPSFRERVMSLGRKCYRSTSWNKLSSKQTYGGSWNQQSISNFQPPFFVSCSLTLIVLCCFKSETW